MRVDFVLGKATDTELAVADKAKKDGCELFLFDSVYLDL